MLPADATSSATAVLPATLSVAALSLPALEDAPASPAQPSVQPVVLDLEVFDAAELIKAVQLAEQEIERLAAEREAAELRAAEEKVTADREAAKKQAEEDEDGDESDNAAAASTGSSDCGLDTSNLGAVKSHVREAANFLGCLFGEPTVLGVAGRAGTSDHPSGKALDFMVDRSTGDALAECVLRNHEALGVTYVIWRQRINHGNGFEAMEDRGGATANHMDHVHVSFESSSGSKDLQGC